MFAIVDVRVYAFFMFSDLLYRLEGDGSQHAETGFEGAESGLGWPHPEAVWRFDGSRPDCGDAADTAVTKSMPRSGGIDPDRVGGAGSAAGSVECEGLGSLGYGDLEELVVGLAAERARVEGRYLAAVGELASRYGAQAAAFVLRDQTRLNSSQARSEARLAESLVAEGMTATLDAMQSGEIAMSHAKVIAREVPKKHRRSEESFLELCRVYPSDTVARHPLAYESLEVFADLDAEAAAKDLSPVDAELARQRAQRWGSMKLGDDGMWHLHGTFDFLAGRQVNTALQAMIRSLRRRAENAADTSNVDGTAAEHGDVNNGTDATGQRVAAEHAHGGVNGTVESLGDVNGGRDAAGDCVAVEHAGGGAGTRAQLTADAIADLIAGTSNIRRRNTSLVIVADYDVVNDRLADPRLDDGTPLSAKMVADHAVDANILPAVFASDWSELALGRTRNASDAQRLILAMRDGGCIGCALTAEHTEAHHIDYYENGGLTEVPNLASLCFDCHTDLHQHGRQIHTPPDGKPRLQPPDPKGTGPSNGAPAASRSP